MITGGCIGAGVVGRWLPAQQSGLRYLEVGAGVAEQPDFLFRRFKVYRIGQEVGAGNRATDQVDGDVEHIGRDCNELPCGSLLRR